MTEIWTLGRWVTKPGQEEAFADAWREMAEWTLGEFPGSVGTLLRDRERRNVFFSFGPWRDLEQAETWRAMPGFGERVRRIRELLEDFEPHTLDPAAIVGGPAGG